jgi:hypothetical protein
VGAMGKTAVGENSFRQKTSLVSEFKIKPMKNVASSVINGKCGMQVPNRQYVRKNNVNGKRLLSFPIHHFLPLEYMGRRVHVMN